MTNHKTKQAHLQTTTGVKISCSGNQIFSALKKFPLLTTSHLYFIVWHTEVEDWQTNKYWCLLVILAAILSESVGEKVAVTGRKILRENSSGHQPMVPCSDERCGRCLMIAVSMLQYSLLTSRCWAQRLWISTCIMTCFWTSPVTSVWQGSLETQNAEMEGLLFCSGKAILLNHKAILMNQEQRMRLPPLPAATFSTTDFGVLHRALGLAWSQEWCHHLLLFYYCCRFGFLLRFLGHNQCGKP